MKIWTALSRARKLGYKPYVVPSSIIYHKKSMSSARAVKADLVSTSPVSNCQERLVVNEPMMFKSLYQAAQLGYQITR